MLEYMKANDHFARELGAEWLTCEPGRAELRLELAPRHMTDVGRPHLHAGVLYTLAESASAGAILPYGWNCYAVEGRITYLDAVAEGAVTAVARGKDAHDQPSGSCKVRVTADDGRVIAQAVFTIFYTGEPFDAAGGKGSA